MPIQSRVPSTSRLRTEGLGSPGGGSTERKVRPSNLTRPRLVPIQRIRAPRASRVPASTRTVPGGKPSFSVQNRNRPPENRPRLLPYPNQRSDSPGNAKRLRMVAPAASRPGLKKV